ncbi:hypothetical protein [Tenuibacillus multivorans]|uniref:Uncharacterized protein n=1 Tax=Tenuibacillus multivorans TaxID=237069 RepID=A0A1G9XSB6_9BACI|nr:hypothetical protein [Tenuibacillus multivorans]GEL75776.1 hypothetical protein TMU01_00110 [Tenuibacillus multivorans]SDM99055.1 hypothetical protein SAMN05216498_1069 [Tenuibacillus multivorans]
MARGNSNRINLRTNPYGSFDQNLFNAIKRLVYKILKNEDLLAGEWRFGEVESVVNDTRLMVKVNGFDPAIEIPCNPDATFNVGDRVFVHYVNRNPSDRFVPYRCG